MRRLAKTEAGFGLIELLIAMTVMVIAIMAIVAAFSSGMVALNRASRASTAATLADMQMETYRAIRWDNIVLKKTLVDTALVDRPARSTATWPAATLTDTCSSSYCSTTRTRVARAVAGDRADGGLPDRHVDRLGLRRRNAQRDQLAQTRRTAAPARERRGP